MNALGQAPETLIGHLLELRDRLLKAVLVYAAVFLALLPFAERLYTLTADPLLRHLPQGTTMISTEIAGTFFVPMKLALFVALLITAPVMLYQAWAFVAPGLYRHERRYALPLLLAATVLFYAGVAFTYFVMLPVMFGWFASLQIVGVSYSPDITNYLSFVLVMFLCGGISFEVPIAVVVSVMLGWITPQQLAAARGYVVVAIFIIAALLTPPDGLSQVMMAVPMWLLFEAGIVCARLIGPRRSEA